MNNAKITNEFLVNNMRKKSVEQFNIFLQYTKNLISSLSSYELKVFSEEDLKLLRNNEIDFDIIEEMKKEKTAHNIDGRTVEELYLMLLIHDIIEKSTIIECNLLGIDLQNNECASHIEKTKNVNSECDLILNNYNIEQQTSIKKYNQIYCKAHKLKSLRKKDKPTYILQKYINPYTLKAMYALVNVNDNFIDADTQMSNGSFKKVLKTENKYEYKTIQEILKPLIT